MKPAWLCGLVLSVIGMSGSAWACGGMFCSRAPTGPGAAPQPVDQNAERILFEVTDTQVTVHVQIQVVGEAKDFAWIVPSNHVPDFGTSSQLLFQNLDAMSRRTAVFPPVSVAGCSSSVPTGGGGGFGCGAMSDSVTASATTLNARGTVPESKAVTVYASETFGAFKADVIGGEKTADVIQWLQERQYNVSDNMLPAFDQYNGPGKKFVAIKLQRDKTLADVTPIKLILPKDTPCVPIRLTRVSAQPLMGIQIYIASSTPWVPQNYGFGPPDPAAISFFPDGTTNYFAWVARAVGDAGGRWFVQERVMKLSDPQAKIAAAVDPSTAAIVNKHQWLSRYYTRMSPEDMTEDPEFFAAPSTALVESGKTLDFSGRPTLWGCLSNQEVAKRTPGPCARVYCGPQGTCYEQSGAAQCQCPNDQVVQRFLGPDGNSAMTCVPAKHPMGVTPETVGAGTTADPCKAFSCGSGTCVLRGGFPTCTCSAGSGQLDAGIGIKCLPVSPGAVNRGHGGGAESVTTADARDVTQPTGRRFAFAGMGVVLLGLLAGLRRARRR